MSKGYGKRIRRLENEDDKPRRVEWQLEGKYVCNYCEGPFKIEKFTIPEVDGGFCMPECVAGYNWYILVDDREEYHEKIENFCGRRVNKAPPHYLMKVGKSPGYTQDDIYSSRYDNLSSDEVKIAKKEIGDQQ